MKKLEDYMKEQNEELSEPKKAKDKPDKNSMAYFMPVKMDRQEAIDAKLKNIQGSFFGRPINKIKVGSMTDVWVPYSYFVYSYEIGKGGGKLNTRRSGKVHIIYDMNEKHCIQYDEIEEGPLPVEKKDTSAGERMIIKVDRDKEKMFDIVEDYIQRQIMYKTFARKAKVKCIKHFEFYRPAVMLEVFFKEKNRNIRFAYLDSYAVKSEHILGMKYRITH